MKQLYLDDILKKKKEKTIVYTASTTFTPEHELEYMRKRFDEATKELLNIKWYRIFKRNKLMETINYSAKRIKKLNKIVKK